MSISLQEDNELSHGLPRGTMDNEFGSPFVNLWGQMGALAL